MNKANTKVSLRFDLNASQELSEEQKQLLRQRLAGWMNKQGILRLDGDRKRSQIGNREEVIRRFVSLVRAVLHVNKSRRKTKPSKTAKKRRLQVKKIRGRLKRQRGKRDFPDQSIPQGCSILYKVAFPIVMQ